MSSIKFSQLQSLTSPPNDAVFPAVSSGSNYKITLSSIKTAVIPSWSEVTGKPNFNSVAFSGLYADLSGKPTIPVIPTLVSAFTNDKGYLATVDYGIITNTPQLSAVATSGNWNDVVNKPAWFNTIAPGYLYSDGSGTLTFQNVIDTSGGVSTATVKALIANSLSNFVSGVSTATVTSLIANSLSNFVSGVSTATVTTLIANSLTNNLATVARTGNWNDVVNKPAWVSTTATGYLYSDGNGTLSYQYVIDTSGGVSTATVKALIANSLSNFVSGVSTATVTALIANSLTNFVTTDTVISLIANSLTNYATQSYVTSQGYLTTASVATLIANSLTNNLATVARTGNWTDVVNKPAWLSTTATGYLYSDGTGTLGFQGGAGGSTSTLVNGTYTVALVTTGQLNLPGAANTESGNARIQSTNSIDILSNLSLWTFGTDGSLAFPNTLGSANSQIYTTNGGYQTIFETFTTGNQGSGQKLTLDWDDASVKIQSQLGTEWKFGADGVLTLPQMHPNNYNGFRNLSHIDAPVDADLRLRTYGNGHASLRVISTTSNNTRTLLDLDLDRVRISTNNDEADVGGTNDWLFAADGNLTLPGGQLIGGSDSTQGVTMTTARGTVLFGNQPEVMITQTSHWHIMAADSSATDLFFGNDANFVKLPRGTNDVVIGNDNNYNWTFGDQGTLTLPLGGTITETARVTQGGDTPGTMVLTPNGVYNPWNNLTIYNTAFNPETQHIHLASGDLNRTEIVLGNDNKFVKVNIDGSVCVNSSPYYFEGALAFEFQNDGTHITEMHFSLGVYPRLYYVAVGDIITDVSNGNTAVISYVQFDSNVSITCTILMDPAGTSPMGYSFSKSNRTGGVWQFGTDGSLTLPNLGLIDFNSPYTRLKNTVTGQGAQLGSPDDQNYVNVDNTAVTIQVNSDGIGGAHALPQHNWQFGTDGGLTFPDGATILNNKITAAPEQSLLLYGGSTQEGQGKNIQLFGGYAESTSTNSYDGGRVRIYAGQGVNGGAGGYVRFRTYGTDTTNHNLKLDSDGVVYLPYGSQIDFNAPYSRFKDAENTGVQLGSPDDQNYVNVDNTAVTIQVNSDGIGGAHALPQHNWIFGQDGTIVSETGRNITGELSGQTDSGTYFGHQPIAIKHASGYKRLLGVTNSATTWLNLTDVGTQLGINPAWIMGMVIDYQALSSNFSGGTTGSMVGQIIIASSNLSSRDISVTHSEAVCLTGNDTVPVFSALDLWHANGYALQAIRTDTNSQQLDIIWTAKVFVNASEDYC